MQIDPLLGKTRKYYASRFYQLKIGHGAIVTFVNRIQVVGIAECWWSGDAEQSVIHCMYIHKAPEMARRTSSAKEEPRESRDSMAKAANRKKSGWQSC